MILFSSYQKFSARFARVIHFRTLQDIKGMSGGVPILLISATSMRFAISVNIQTVVQTFPRSEKLIKFKMGVVTYQNFN